MTQGFRLSPLQRYIWQTGSPGKALVSAWLEGELQGPVFARALETLAQRHEILRTVYTPVPEMALPLQEVREIAHPVFVPVDLSELGEDGQKHRLAELLENPLPDAPLVCVLARLSARKHYLILGLPVSSTDTTAQLLLLKELREAYESVAGGFELPEPEMQHVQFSEWHNYLFESGEFREEINFWQSRKPPRPYNLTLPLETDHPAGASAMRRVRHRLEGEAVAGIRQLLENKNFTPESFFLSLWALLAWRLTGQPEIWLTLISAGRRYREMLEVPALFARLLPLQVAPDPPAGFTGQVQAVNATLQALGEMEDYCPPTAFSPLAFEMVNSSGFFKPGSFAVTPDRLEWHPDNFKLKLLVLQDAQGFELRFYGDGARVELAELERIAARYLVALEDVLDSPEVELKNIGITGANEKAWILSKSLGTPPEGSSDVCIHRLFEQAVQLYPEAPALVYESERLTFKELDEKANRLANFLVEQGVGPETPVGICLDRSSQMITGVLGVLKAGGYYVPLDPRFPMERREYMLADAGINLVLTQQSLAGEFNRDRYRSVCLDRDWPVIARANGAAPAVRILPENLAYLIYTSGSTGVPKGVGVEHRQLTGYCRAVMARLNLPPGATYATVSTLAADLGNTVIFPSLISGGCLHVISWQRIFDSAMLSAYFQANPVDCLKIVPSHLSALLDWAYPERLLPEKRLVLGGESWPWELAERLQELKPALTILNHYGPTETTVGVVTYSLANEKPPFFGNPPLGSPLDGLNLYVLDGQLQPVPFGVTGELYIGGAGVTRGYIFNAPATAEKFLPDPFSGIAGSRMYRSGDMARLLPDGNFEFLGRVDNQLKIRGFRIEPGEVEQALRQLGPVRETAVITGADRQGQPQLVAYVSLKAEEQLKSERELYQEQLREWQSVFNETHGQLQAEPGVTFNNFGWTSSYTGQPIPPEEIREQVAGIKEQILEWKPDRVLEIGCGTGLLLFEIAPHCRHYTGTDFSAAMLRYTRQVLSGTDFADRVTLLERSAPDFSGLEPGSFDVILLNSVVQYFPNLDYLLELLSKAAGYLRPGGRIFLGDVRNLRLLEAFHTAVQLQRMEPEKPAALVALLARQQIMLESELVIDPDFFKLLPALMPPVGVVEIRLKRGRAFNELTCFRYDVVITIGSRKFADKPIRRLEWGGALPDLQALARYLLEEKPPALFIGGIPNARLTEPLELVKLLASRDCPQTAGELKAALAQNPGPGVDPEDFRALAQDRAGYRVVLSWSDDPACFEALFLSRPGDEILRWQAETAFASATRLVMLSNNPLLKKLTPRITKALRTALEPRLPDYMLPAVFVVLPALPLSQNGKVDYQALPPPEQARPETEEYHPPRNALEQVIASIWSEVLNLDKISVYDNFFELGGHSLLATQVVSRLRAIFPMELPLRQFFEEPSVAALARALVNFQEVPGKVERIAEIWQKVQAMSAEEVQQRLGQPAAGDEN
jgi:amino acid adenylation domain-containing protein